MSFNERVQEKKETNWIIIIFVSIMNERGCFGHLLCGHQVSSSGSGFDLKSSVSREIKVAPTHGQVSASWILVGLEGTMGHLQPVSVLLSLCWQICLSCTHLVWYCLASTAWPRPSTCILATSAKNLLFPKTRTRQTSRASVESEFSIPCNTWTQVWFY